MLVQSSVRDIIHNGMAFLQTFSENTTNIGEKVPTGRHCVKLKSKQWMKHTGTTLKGSAFWCSFWRPGYLWRVALIFASWKFMSLFILSSDWSAREGHPSELSLSRIVQFVVTAQMVVPVWCHQLEIFCPWLQTLGWWCAKFSTSGFGSSHRFRSGKQNIGAHWASLRNKDDHLE